ADAVQLRTAVLFGSKRREPFGALAKNQGDVAEGLDVVHRRRAVVEADHRGKWRLVARLRAFALERFEQSRLFTGFVRARAAMDVDVALETGPENVLAEKSSLIGLLERLFENPLDVEELAANVDIGHFGADGIAGDRASFDQQMRIPLHEQVILER